jgi:hydroxypyruvate reductase
MNPEEDLPRIFAEALRSVDPYSLVTERTSVDDDILTIRGMDGVVAQNIKPFERVVVVGAGKASCRMAKAVEDILGDRIEQGLVVTKYGHAERLSRIRVIEAGHPVPDGNSVEGAHTISQILRESGENTLILCLVSGGGSSLLTSPRQGITLEDKRQVTELLLSCGANINEVNCVRKHLSEVKGGNLARLAFPARTIVLILSDVVGDRLDTIASGITAPDPTTFAQAWGILARYGIRDRVPAPVAALIRKGLKGAAPETAKEQDPCFSRVTNAILGSNLAACRTAKDQGGLLGYRAHLLTTSLSGESSQAAKFFFSLAVDIARGVSDFPMPALIVAGGETTVTIRGSGRGGRNQEMALAFLAGLCGEPSIAADIFFMSGATDGTDGPTDAAGALITPALVRKVSREGPDPAPYLANNDSRGFFEKAGGLFRTGPTGTNVCDIQLLAVT